MFSLQTSRFSRTQAGPKPRPKPGPKLGPGQISGNLEIWDLEIRKFGIQKIQKIKILKIKIRVAQNVGKVWISRKRILLAPFGVISGKFFHGPAKCTKIVNFCLFSLVGQWALFTHCVAVSAFHQRESNSWRLMLRQR